MTHERVQLEWRPEFAAMQALFREAGMLFIACDLEGGAVRSVEACDDWLHGLVDSSDSIDIALQEKCGHWNDQDVPEPCEAVEGLWLLPIALLKRRCRIGYAIALLPTEALLAGAGLERLCADTEADVEQMQRRLAMLPPAAITDLPRLFTLVRGVYDSQKKISSDRGVIESVGQQLAESYEEINLLYTITKSLTEADRPERLVASACRELLSTLPFAWIGALFADDPRQLKRLSKRFLVAGDTGQSMEKLRPMALNLLNQAEAGSPMVFEPGAKVEHAHLHPLGRTVLIYPISRDDKVLGLLIAGGKQGDDTIVSSADIKLVGATAGHLSIFLENASLYDDLNAMFLGTLEALTSAIDAKDPYTCGHSQRVAHLTKKLAEAAGLDEVSVERMHITGLVHDVGKIGVPEGVLTKPGKLTKEEFDLIKMHPEIGYRILKDIPQLQDILPGVLHHHEAWGGGGYPAGIAGEQIPLVARVIALADSFDAMSSTRTYRSAMSRTEVLEEINRCTGTQFDPTLAPLFVKLDFAEYDRMTREQRDREVNEGQFGGQAA